MYLGLIPHFKINKSFPWNIRAGIQQCGLGYKKIVGEICHRQEIKIIAMILSTIEEKRRDKIKVHYVKFFT